MAQLLASNQEYVLIVRRCALQTLQLNGAWFAACWDPAAKTHADTASWRDMQDVRPKDETQYMLPKGELARQRVASSGPSYPSAASPCCTHAGASNIPLFKEIDSFDAEAVFRRVSLVPCASMKEYEYAVGLQSPTSTLKRAPASRTAQTVLGLLGVSSPTMENPAFKAQLQARPALVPPPAVLLHCRDWVLSVVGSRDPSNCIRCSIPGPQHPLFARRRSEGARALFLVTTTAACWTQSQDFQTAKCPEAW